MFRFRFDQFFATREKGAWANLTLASVFLLTVTFGQGALAQSNGQVKPLGDVGSKAHVSSFTTAGGHTITFHGVKYDFQAPGNSTWYYSVTSGSSPNVSHSVFGVPSCASIIDAGTWNAPDKTSLNSGSGTPLYGNDPTTGVTGVKFDTGVAAGETGYYYFSLDGNYSIGHITAGVKAGSNEELGQINGPNAFCNELQPDIDIEKSTNGEDADTPTGPTLALGATVNWTYEVTNTGDVTLSGVTVTDDQGVSVSCPKSTLTAGESMTCTASGTAEIGQYKNIGTATGTYNGDDVSDTDPSHYIVEAAPSIDIEKATNGEDADTPTGPTLTVGDPVNWTYEVTNTGNVTLSGITVTDDQGVSVSCPKSMLTAGESMTCTAHGAAVEGQYSNIGTATGTYNGDDVSDTDPSHYIGESAPAPSIDIEKATNGEDADTPTGPTLSVGDAVNWTYEVTNTGNVTLSGITVTDDQGVSVSCPETTLASGESMTCTANGTAVEGQYANIGTATGTYEESDVSDTDPSHYFGANAGIEVIKKTNGDEIREGFCDEGTIIVGLPVNWTYEVTNTGNQALEITSIMDDNGTPGEAGDDFSPGAPVEKLNGNDDNLLDPGETWVYEAAGSAVEGEYSNIVTVEGQVPDSGTNVTAKNSHNLVSSSDVSGYCGIVVDLAIEKTDGGLSFTPEGEAFSYTLTYKNLGDVDLTGVVITETVPEHTVFSSGDSTPGWSCADGAAAGTTCTFNVQGTVAAGASGTVEFGLEVLELVQPNPFTGECPTDPPDFVVNNTASIVDDGTNGEDTNPDNNQDSDDTPVLTSCTPEQQTPSIQIDKSPDSQLVEEGGTANFTITVTNNGPVDLINVVVSDPEAPGCDKEIGNLASEGVNVYNCELHGVTESFTNVATVTGETSDGGNVSDEDDADVSVLNVDEPEQSIPIPTMSEWSLILMAGLMLMLGAVRAREWTRR